jgi:hypothetical protein
MDPSDSHHGPPRLRSPLYAAVDAPPASPERVSSTAPFLFHNMPSLLPRKISAAASVLQAAGHWPSPYVHWVGIFDTLTRLRLGSLALRPAALPIGNSRPPVARTPLPWATKAHGQLLGRDFNPQDEQLLLRTHVVSLLTFFRPQQPHKPWRRPSIPDHGCALGWTCFRLAGGSLHVNIETTFPFPSSSTASLMTFG